MNYWSLKVPEETYTISLITDGSIEYEHREML